MSEARTRRGADVIPLAPRRLDREALVRGLRAGERAATAAFFDQYQPRINRLIWRLLGADPEHDDVVHQAFMQILRSIGKLKDPRALDEWVNRIVINTVRKEIRSRRYRRRVIVMEELPEQGGPALDPADRLLTLRFYQALDRLSAEDRIVLVLRFVEQHTLDEIAGINSYSLATAKRRLNRAVRAFKKIVVADPLLASALQEKTDVQ